MTVVMHSTFLGCVTHYSESRSQEICNNYKGNCLLNSILVSVLLELVIDVNSSRSWSCILLFLVAQLTTVSLDCNNLNLKLTLYFCIIPFSITGSIHCT